MSGFTVYYTIKPKDELNQIVLQAGTKRKLNYPWLKPSVWENKEDFFSNTIYTTTIVKIAFMVEITRYRHWMNEDIIELLFGKPPQFSISTFDRLWEIERFELSGEVFTTMRQAKAEDIKLIQMTGDSAIDKLLTDSIQYKEENNS